MIILRFFMGMAGVAPVAIGPGVVADLFEPEERGQAMAMYTLSPILGPCIGPIYAGWIVQEFGEDKWPWIFWVSTMLGGVITVLGLFFLQETYTPVLLEQKARRTPSAEGDGQRRVAHSLYHERAAACAHLARSLASLYLPCDTARGPGHLSVPRYHVWMSVPASCLLLACV